MDGARLFHATASLGVNAKEICQYVDSVMVCISKGIGAPVGALMCSTKAKVDEGREIRKILGGGWRQGGVFAAPGIYAFKHNISRMIEDIENARLTASLLQGKLQHISLQKEVQSNILVLDLAGASVAPSRFCEMAKEKGLLIKTVLKTCVRLVYYKGITAEDAKAAANIILELDKSL